MGVTGLWTVVAPTARPTSLASLNRKRLAVDASIWIYQFLKAVRDKEGNALRNSHVVGFFRRICKLLYFGIKPVFVFDGGAPALKRETVLRRRRRREGRRDDAVRTAAKLVSVQMERAAAAESRRARKGEGEENGNGDGDGDGGWQGDERDLVYVDEIGMDPAQRQRERRQGFRKTDQYHLPDLDVSIESLRGADDPRIMSQAELEDYARQFHSGEDVNLYDFSKIDFESPFFLSLPAGDRYNILNAARLRSRLRMGYSKEQLDALFPDRMAFSKFQIERVRERNELTQRLMHINGMAEGDLAINQGGRIAGEKGKEYVLVRNAGVEGGWALGVVSNKKGGGGGTSRDNAIDLDAPDEDDEFGATKTDDERQGEGEGDEDDFEDVAIEGLNRLPRAWKRKRKEGDYDLTYEEAAAEIARKRKAVYDARKEVARGEAERRQQRREDQDPDTSTMTTATAAVAGDDGLFVAQDSNGAALNEDAADGDDALFEDINIEPQPDEDDDLQRAIAMSLEQPNAFSDAAGQAESTIANTKQDDDDDDDDEQGFDLTAALAESRKSKPAPKPSTDEPLVAARKFDGPLPFESLNLGQSLLGKKKKKQASKIEEHLSGGFERNLGTDTFRKERPPQPIPSWFEAAPRTEDLRLPPRNGDSGQDADRTGGPLRNHHHRRRRSGRTAADVIDLEAEPEVPQTEPVDISSDDEEKKQDQQREREQDREMLEWEMPDEVARPPDAQEEALRRKEEQEREERYRLAREIAGQEEVGNTRTAVDKESVRLASSTEKRAEENAAADDIDEGEEGLEWTDSEAGGQDATSLSPTPDPLPRPESAQKESKTETRTRPVPDEDEEFEDVHVESASPPSPLAQLQQHVTSMVAASSSSSSSSSSLVPEVPMEQYFLPEEDDEVDAEKNNNNNKDPQSNNNRPEEEYEFGPDDAEEEELMRQLAIEAEEHARFANSLNNSSKPTTTTAEQASRDYEHELKQLRNQQKRDRRDADEVTQVMIQECQALLSLFGLPYITAPMEAEAQCAELVALGLVDGIVTDDSDIFLFGGTRIYKNMFNAAKFVECYVASDLEKEYSLDRAKLIRFAHLLGSDYTEGVPGIGPVTALEIITDFASLAEFKDWCARVQQQQLTSRATDAIEKEGLLLNTPFRRKFKRTAQKRIFLPPQFPDHRVDHAYLHPDVDHSPEPFQWGVPDVDKLRRFLMATVGWSQERTDEILVPVVRDMNKREREGTQANLTRFFTGAVGVGGRNNNLPLAAGGSGGGGDVGVTTTTAAAPRNRTGKESGRMKNAYKRLRGEAERRKRHRAGGVEGGPVVEEDEEEENP